MDNPQPYFSDPAARDRLAAELASWIGTPFRHMCGIKGLGVDCIHFVTRIIQATVPDHPNLVIPEYPRQWHLHQEEELLLNGIVSQVRAVPVDFSAPLDGDIHLFRFGKTISHSAVYFGGLIYHSVAGAKVVAIPWDDPMWVKRRRKAFRIVSK